MQPKTRKSLKIIGIILLGLLLLVFTANYVIQSKIDSALKENLPNNLQLTYEDSSFNILTASYQLTQVEVTIPAKKEALHPSVFRTPSLKFQHLDYFKYLFQNKIQLSKILIDTPTMEYQTQTHFPKKEAEGKGPSFFVNEIAIEEGTLLVSKDSLKEAYFAQGINLSLFQVEKPKNPQSLPFANFSFRSDSIAIQISPYDLLSFGSTQMDKSVGSIQNTSLKTTYSKEALSKAISSERDHYTISIPEISYTHFRFVKDSTLGYATQNLTLQQPNIEIYRDKRQPDTYRTKPLISKMLRDLAFPLKVDTLAVKNASITYEEKIRSDRKPGRVDFTQLNATALKVGNAFPKEAKTQIEVRSNILKDTPLQATWEFEVHNPKDEFTFKAEVDEFEAEELNSFTIPSDKLKIQGDFLKTYFTITGNDNSSHVDLKVRYNDLEIKLLKEDLTEKKDILSAIANIFVAKKSTDEDGSYRKASANVSRAKNKSNFNYIWINILAGLKQSVL